MLVVNKDAASKPRPLQSIELGRGAIAHVRALDALEIKFVIAEARAELNAIVAGGETKRDWVSITPERRKLLQGDADEAVMIGVQSWMSNVLLAAASVERIEGVVDEDNQPLTPSFELFELLFTDAEIESRFKMSGGKIERMWAEEKNGSRPGPGGSGPVDATIATPAAPPATPAPAAASESSPTSTAADGASALSGNLPLEPAKGNSPLNSPPSQDSGSPPA